MSAASVPPATRRLRTSLQTVERCLARLANTEARIQRSNSALGRSVEQLARSEGVLKRDTLALPEPAMPHPPGSDQNALAQRCPKCGDVLTFHNSRTELATSGTTIVITVYFCRKHGFYHLSEQQPLTPGM